MRNGSGPSTARRGSQQKGSFDREGAASRRGRQRFQGLTADSGKVVVDGDLERAEELGVLVGEAELSVATPFRVKLLTMHDVRLAVLVETDGDFENQEEIVTRRADASHDLRNLLGIGEGFVDGVAGLVDELFELVVEVQSSPGVIEFSPT